MKEVGQLDLYRWSGHSVIMGTQKRGWQARAEILSQFAKSEGVGKRKYRQFISEGISLGKKDDFVPEGATKDEETTLAKRSSDPRILGCDSFVEKILAKVGHSGRQPLIPKRKQIDFEGLMNFVVKEFGVATQEIKGEVGEGMLVRPGRCSATSA